MSAICGKSIAGAATRASRAASLAGRPRRTSSEREQAMQPDNQSIISTLGMATPEASLASGPTKQFITFTLDALEYGIDIMVVREIKGWAHTTMIPNAPPHVRGVINLRGIIVPIFDLRAR